jgi:CBS domain-containing protein
MKVRDVMTRSAVCCTSNTNFGAAVELLWSHDCGMLPVTNNDNQLVGVVTDRDICIAMGTRNRLPGDLTIGEVAVTNVFKCRPDDEIHEALATMAEKHVRRLPVVDETGTPLGILSMDDVITHGDLNKWEGCCELSAEEIVRSLKRLYAKPTMKEHAKAKAA